MAWVSTSVCIYLHTLALGSRLDSRAWLIQNIDVLYTFVITKEIYKIKRQLKYNYTNLLVCGVDLDLYVGNKNSQIYDIVHKRLFMKHSILC